MFDRVIMIVGVVIASFCVLMGLLSSLSKEGFLRHFPRRKSLSYIIGTARADDHERPWHSYRFSWHHNKPVDNKDRDNYQTKHEYAVEWSALRRGRTSGKIRSGFGLGWHVTRGGGDYDGSDLSISLYFGRLLSLWFHLNGPWLHKICTVSEKRDPKYHWEGREYRLSLFDGVNWFRFEWGTLPNHWGKDTPGIEISSASLARFFFGYISSEKELLREGRFLVPLPEGTYQGTWKEERYKQHYTKLVGKLYDFFKRRKWSYSWTGDIPGGIPIQGKGENSYDCGMDGIYSLSTGPQRSPQALSGAFVRSVLEGREAYGGPNDLPGAMTVAQAEHWYMTRQG